MIALCVCLPFLPIGVGVGVVVGAGLRRRVFAAPIAGAIGSTAGVCVTLWAIVSLCPDARRAPSAAVLWGLLFLGSLVGSTLFSGLVALVGRRPGPTPGEPPDSGPTGSSTAP